LAACGKKGPPLPPLVKLPTPPADLSAERRGDTVDLQFTVPSTNTDNTRPANVVRVDVYAFTGPADVADADVIKQGTKVASVAVKAPRDPNQTIEPDESAADVEPLEGKGLDQGVLAHVEERLTETRAPSADETAPTQPVTRTYVGVGVTTKGRRGPTSTRVAVPLGPAPPAPSDVKLTYDEKAVTVAWAPPPTSTGTLAYHVYETPADVASGLSRTETRTETALTKMPIAETRYTDARIAWGTTRCYAVRAVETEGSLTVQSDETAPACAELKDTFPPAAPQGLNAVASEGAISLIWDASPEPDVDGYLVLRGAAPGETLASITPSPIHETTFRDSVPTGTRYVYTVQAVDKAGNISAPSNRVEETAR
jgi:hypothetical protein